MYEADFTVRLGEGIGEIIGRQVERHRDDRHQPRRHRLHRRIVGGHGGAEVRHVGRPPIETDQPLAIDDVRVPGSAVASNVEALAKIGLGVPVDRRMPDDLAPGKACQRLRGQ